MLYPGTGKQVKVKINQIWKDKKNGDLMSIVSRNGDYWNCNFARSRVNHKMSEFVIKRFYILT